MRIRYNSPVILTFSIISFIVLLLNGFTGGRSTALLFCVYRSSFSDPLTYLRMFLHVLGHSSLSHYMGNILLMLVVGPPLEEKFGSKSILGASGIVFMLIVMLSMTGKNAGSIPLTMILVLALYIGREVYNGITTPDNISQLTHIIGGICGAAIGNVFYSRGGKRRR